MVKLLKKAWDDVMRPLMQRPSRKQVAAMCYKGTGKDRKILVITSRETKRWILPKGWPIEGLKANEAAAQEAWEEAGVKPANIASQPIGSYDYDKRLNDGTTVTCATQVYAIEVDRLEDNFPETDERTRRWARPLEAAALVEEPGLQDILKAF